MAPSQTESEQSERSWFDRIFPYLIGVLLAAPLVIGPVAAQGGAPACPFPQQVADGISSSVQDVLLWIFIAAGVMAGVAEGFARFKSKNPQQASEWRGYRNNVALATITPALVIWAVLYLAQNFGFLAPSCVDLNPFF